MLFQILRGCYYNIKRHAQTCNFPIQLLRRSPSVNTLWHDYKQIDVAMLSCVSSGSRAKEDYLQRVHTFYNVCDQFINNRTSCYTFSSNAIPSRASFFSDVHHFTISSMVFTVECRSFYSRISSPPFQPSAPANIRRLNTGSRALASRMKKPPLT